MDQAFSDIIQHLRKDLSGLQVGRVSAAVLDDVVVEAYGTHTALSQLATISAQGAQLLVIQPWDASIIKDVERALRTCGRDYNPVVDGTTIRLPFPPLTEEKRRDIAKLVAKKCEEAHVHIKQLREDLMQALKQQKADKTISEDAWFGQHKAIQKSVDDANATVATTGKDKTDDIMKL
jgi:ribosome recycling factor